MKKKNVDIFLPKKILLRLLAEITFSTDFFCLNCLHSFRTENKLKSHKQVSKKKDFCWIHLPTQKNNKLEFNQYMKSDKSPYIIYVDIESWIFSVNNLDISGVYIVEKIAWKSFVKL